MYRAQEDHWLAKVAGFLFVPIAGALLGRVVTRAVVTDQTSDQDAVDRLIIANSAAQLLGAFFAYQASERSDLSETAQGFARGGMWGSLISAASVPIAAQVTYPSRRFVR